MKRLMVLFELLLILQSLFIINVHSFKLFKPKKDLFTVKLSTRYPKNERYSLYNSADLFNDFVDRVHYKKKHPYKTVCNLYSKNILKLFIYSIVAVLE